MIYASVYCTAADGALNRRACAKPDLPHGRAYSNDCRAWDVCSDLLDRSTKRDRLPRSGMAHAAFDGGCDHA